LREAARRTEFLAAFAACALAGALGGCLRPPFAPSTAPAPGTASLAVFATDAQGDAAGDAVVILRSADRDSDSRPAARRPTAVVTLIDKRIHPRVSAVAVGTEVTFRNLDEVDHHVYSFSTARPFALRLPAGAGAASAVFDAPGVLVLGCKVHGEMIAHLYVTDAEVFGKTDGHGYLRLAGLAPGSYEVEVWRAGGATRDAGVQRVTLAPGVERALRVRAR
jgi:plastocyanin